MTTFNKTTKVLGMEVFIRTPSLDMPLPLISADEAGAVQVDISELKDRLSPETLETIDLSARIRRLINEELDKRVPLR